MWQVPANVVSLREALLQFGFSNSLAMVISTAPDKFLFPDVLANLKGKTIDGGCSLADIIAKADVLVSPGESLSELEEVISQRVILLQCLKQVVRIKMPINRLVTVLLRLVPLNVETIQECLGQDSSMWEQVSLQSNNLEENKDAILTSE